MDDDGNKNVSDVVSYQAARGAPAHYEYAPFGAVTAATTNTAFTAFNVAETNPFRFSSEYADDMLGLVYYNYRHYNPEDGRWTSRDPLINKSSCSLKKAEMLRYAYSGNDVLGKIDRLGLDNPGCDLPGFMQVTGENRDCIRRCCAAHDECYYQNNCSAYYWGFNVLGLLGGGMGEAIISSVSSCARCNEEVVACYVACSVGIDFHKPVVPTDKDKLWFCPKGNAKGQFFSRWKDIPPECFEDDNKPDYPKDEPPSNVTKSAKGCKCR